MPQTVKLGTSDGEMALYDVEPQGEGGGAVVVVQEAFGVNDHIEDVTRRFADLGYRAVAPHLFHRTGDPSLGYDDFSKVMPHMQELSEAGLTADLDATFGYLADTGFNDSGIGIVGFCMGGTVAFLAAARYPLGAAATFYGAGITEGRFGMPPLVDMAPDLKTPWIGLFGDRDEGIPSEQVEQLAAAAKHASVPTDIVRYPDAGHGFHCDQRDSYHAESAADAWNRTVAWFGAHIERS